MHLAANFQPSSRSQKYQCLWPLILFLPRAFLWPIAWLRGGQSKPLWLLDRILHACVVHPNGSSVSRLNVDDRLGPMTIPFGEPEPSDALLSKSVTTTRLRAWLTQRLRQLAADQRIQDARALRSEFSIE